MAAISIRELIKDHGGGPRPAVNGISFEVREGEAFGLLGPNGAGKTTTLNVCTTRMPPTAGEVIVAGYDVRRHPRRVKAKIGVVTQRCTLDRALLIEQNLHYHCRYFAMSRREAQLRTAELLDLFGLRARARDKIDGLSGGMIQRLQIARAIAHRPRVLFLDEPTSGLDPQSRLSLWDAIETLRSEGTTVFLTTHYMEEADQLCDRVAIIDAGGLLACGSPSELKRGSQAPRVITLRLAQPPNGLTPRIAGVLGVRVVEPAPGGLRVHVAAEHSPVPEIVSLAGRDLVDLSVSEPSLETVFISLTGRDLRD